MAKPQRTTRLKDPVTRQTTKTRPAATAAKAANPRIASSAMGAKAQRGRQARKGKGKGKGESYNSVALFLVLLIAMMAFALPSFVILFGGMIPTWLAFIVDDRRVPYRLNTIGACNFAGVVPFLGSLWLHGHDLSYALMVLTDPMAWLTMFLGASTGLGALWVGPHLAAMIYNTRAIKQRRHLELNRRALVDEWGVDVLPPLDAQAKSRSSSDSHP